MPDDIRPEMDAHRGEEAMFLEVLRCEERDQPIQQEYFEKKERWELAWVAYTQDNHQRR